MREVLDVNEYCGTTLKGVSHLETNQQKIISGLVGSLTGRMTDVDEGVLKSMRIVNFYIWPEKDDGNVYFY